MTSGRDAVQRPLDADRYSVVQLRIVWAALDLFAEHGVSGTSLQMIADAIGVTKAAVYHQFRTKEEIVFAVTEVELARLVPVLEAAEAEPTGVSGRELLLGAVIDLAVERRRWVRALQNDPVIVRLLAEHEPFLDLMHRLYSVLIGEDSGVEARVRTAILSVAIGGTVVHPLVADLADDTLKAELLLVARRLFLLPD